MLHSASSARRRIRSSCRLGLMLCLALAGCSREAAKPAQQSGAQQSGAQQQSGSETSDAQARVPRPSVPSENPTGAKADAEPATEVRSSTDQAASMPDPSDNAAVLLWQAMGPAELPEGERAAYFAALGIAPLHDEGPYFVSFADFAGDKPSQESPPADAPPPNGLFGGGGLGGFGLGAQLSEEDRQAWSEAGAGSWTAEALPQVAEWLQRNEQPLARILAAAHKPRLVYPDSPTRIDDVSFAGWHLTDAGQLLTAQRNLHLGAGDLESAWQTTLALLQLELLAAREMADMELALFLDPLDTATPHQFLFASDLTEPLAKQALASLQTLDTDLEHLPARIARQLRSDIASWLDRLRNAEPKALTGEGPEWAAVTAELRSHVDWDRVQQRLDRGQRGFAAALAAENSPDEQLEQLHDVVNGWAEPLIAASNAMGSFGGSGEDGAWGEEGLDELDPFGPDVPSPPDADPPDPFAPSSPDENPFPDEARTSEDDPFGGPVASEPDDPLDLPDPFGPGAEPGLGGLGLPPAGDEEPLDQEPDLLGVSFDDPAAIAWYREQLQGEEWTREQKADAVVALLTQEVVWVHPEDLAGYPQRIAAQVDLLRLGFALSAYRLRHERYPEELADLVPEYLERLPRDPLHGADYHYRTLPEDGFVLQSTGPKAEFLTASYWMERLTIRDERRWNAKRVEIRQQLADLGAEIESTGIDDTAPNHFRMEGPQFSDEHVQWLTAFPELRFAYLGRSRTTDAGLQHLKETPMLWFLHVSETQITDSGLEILRHLPELSSLDISETSITDEGLKHLAECPSLEVLYLGDLTLQGEGLAELAELSKLEHVSMRGTPVGAEHLAHLPGTLNQLDLSGKELTAEHLEQVAKLKSLRRLSLWWSELPADAFAALLELPRLVDLDLMQSGIDDAGLAQVARIETLQALNLSLCENLTEQGVRRLKQLKNLRELNVPFGTSEALIQELQRALPECQIR